MLIITFTVTLITSYAVVGEYLVNNPDVPSYLYRKFDYVEEDVFPRDIRINMSVTRVSGTLLYSIDRHGNQLIATLYDTGEVTLMIEYNNKQIAFSLHELCACKRCRFEIFDLRIQMDENINLQCNGREKIRKKYEKSKALNTNYIIPYSKEEFNTDLPNEAYLWLVNNPEMKGIYPNNDQLLGCLFNVWYRNKPLNFTKVSQRVGSKCQRICNDSICNGGQCLETYQSFPVCNCMTTFKNGLYCNDEMWSMNLKSSFPYYMFDVFKMSWKSYSTEILILENKFVRIRVLRDDTDLSLDYEDMTKHDSIIKAILSRSYKAGNEYILIIAFREGFMDITLHHNFTSKLTVLWTKRDLRSEVFTSLSLRSGNGTISSVYKISNSDYHWNKMKFTKYVNLSNIVVESSSEVPNVPHKVGKNTLIIFGATAGIIAIIILIVVPILKIKWRRFFILKRQRTEEKLHTNEVPMGNTESILSIYLTEMILKEQRTEEERDTNEDESGVIFFSFTEKMAENFSIYSIDPDLIDTVPAEGDRFQNKTEPSMIDI